MVIINPGNPTGQCLSEANLREILHFCYRENLVLLGDEVYQQNIYQDERPFISARKVNILLLLDPTNCCLGFNWYIFLIVFEGFDGHGATIEQGNPTRFIPHCVQRILG